MGGTCYNDKGKDENSFESSFREGKNHFHKDGFLFLKMIFHRIAGISASSCDAGTVPADLTRSFDGNLPVRIVQRE